MATQNTMPSAPFIFRVEELDILKSEGFEFSIQKDGTLKASDPANQAKLDARIEKVKAARAAKGKLHPPTEPQIMEFWNHNIAHPARLIVDGLLSGRSQDVVSHIDRYKWYETTKAMLDRLFKLVITKLEIKEGNSLILRYTPENIDDAKILLRSLSHMPPPVFPFKVPIFLMPESLKLEQADELMMNKAGWYRKESESKP